MHLFASGKHGVGSLLHSFAIVLWKLQAGKSSFVCLNVGYVMQSATIMYIFAGVSAKAEINVEMVCNVISEMLAT